ncbi:MAG TPA: hypothetical protein VFX49_05750 [Chloroflexota bacterium]|nr:hypothetical protein [Chloroflexota bacterium]
MNTLIPLSGPDDPPTDSPTTADLPTPTATAGASPFASRHSPAPPIPLVSRGPAAPLSPTFTPPLIPDVESTPEWQAHLDAVRAFYAPEGYLEDACAFRITASLWRLNRLGRAETDHLAQSLADAERDATSTVASQSTEPSHIRPILPTDVAGLRRCARDARLAAQLLSEFHQFPVHDPIPDDGARVAYYFLAAFYSHSPDNPPADRPPVGWDGASLRSALAKLAVNRSVYDDLAPAAAFARDVAAAAERRLAHVEALTARLRRERLVPHSPLAHDIRESEAALSAQLDQAIRQLDLLQARRRGLPMTA